MLLSELKVESHILSFSNESSKTLPFELVYTTPPIVTAKAEDDVIVYIENVTTTFCTIALSQNFLGNVAVHVTG